MPFVTSHLRGRQNANRMGCVRYRILTVVVQWVKIIKRFLKTENNTKEGVSDLPLTCSPL